MAIASPRKYSLDLNAKIATEVWNFRAGARASGAHSAGASMRMRRTNYLIDYSFVNGGLPGVPTFAQLLGLNAAGETIFSYRYPTMSCTKIYRALPVHLENTKFPTVRTSSAQPLYSGARFGTVTTF